MSRQSERIPGSSYSLTLLTINGAAPEHRPELRISNICKGGFRFSTDLELQLEDRLQVVLHFPDGREQEVLGRICYCEQLDDGFACGFSVISGFYSLTRVA